MQNELNNTAPRDAWKQKLWSDDLQTAIVEN